MLGTEGLKSKTKGKTFLNCFVLSGSVYNSNFPRNFLDKGISLVFSNDRSVLSQCNTRLRLLYLLYDVDFTRRE